MKKAVVLFVVMAFCLEAGIVWSQPGIAPPLPDRLGLYSSPDCESDNIACIGAICTVYCVLTGMSATELSSFEFAVQPATSPSLIHLSDNFPHPNYISILPYPEFLVGFGSPIPPGSLQELVLVSMDFLLLDNSPVHFYLEPLSSGPTIPGSIAYFNGDIEAIPMYPVSGDFALPVFGFNTGPVWYHNGVVVIDVLPDGIAAGWELSGPLGYSHFGVGNEVLPNLRPGTYSLLWQDLPEWTTPTPNPVVFTLNPDGHLAFEGVYQALPQILSVTDVANDQGRQVRVTWQRSPYDVAGMPFNITEYGVYRQQDSPDKLQGWDFVGSAPARRDLEYSFVVPTLCDSTVVGALCESTFMVSAMTPDPDFYFDSLPGTGYSVDNLRPVTPTGFVVAVVAGQNTLTWNAPTDTDVDHYLVYRADNPGNPPNPADTHLAQVHGTSYTDAGGGSSQVYSLVAALTASDMVSVTCLLHRKCAQEQGIRLPDKPGVSIFPFSYIDPTRECVPK